MSFINILENKILENLLYEGKIELYQEKFPSFKEDLDLLKDLKNPLKFLDFTISQLKKKEQIEDILKILKEFEAKEKRLLNKDINSYKSLEELSLELSKIEGESKTQKKEIAKRKGSRVLYEDDKLALILILTEEASIFYGKNTKWCISALEDNAFDDYNNRTDAIIFCISKTDSKKIAFRVINKEIEEIRDARDEEINLKQVQKELDLDDKYFAKFINIIKNVELTKEEMLQSPEKILKYAKTASLEEIPFLEDAIIAFKDAYYIYSFARNIKGADIKRLEDAVAVSGDASSIYYFAEDVKGADIKRLEDAAKNLQKNEVRKIERLALLIERKLFS